MQTEVFLVRHGETDWNSKQIIQGHLDIPLNERGLWQSERLASHLAGIHFDRVYSSDLQRTRVTAERIAAPSKLPVQLERCLRERDFGQFAGLSVDEVRIRRELGLDAGMEDWDSMRRRVCTYVEKEAIRHLGKRLLFVVHGGSIGALLYQFSQGMISAQEVRVDNTSVSLLRFDGERWRVDFWNQTDHLSVT